MLPGRSKSQKLEVDLTTVPDIQMFSTDSMPCSTDAADIYAICNQEHK